MRIGLYGFGASAHIIAQVARWQGRELYAFTRPGDAAAQDFARSRGCTWAAALRSVRKGGRVVCAGVHMSDIPSFRYAELWESAIMSVANLTRADGRAFLKIAGQAGVGTTTTVFALVDANKAIAKLRRGKLEGAAVLVPAVEGERAA